MKIEVMEVRVYYNKKKIHTEKYKHCKEFGSWYDYELFLFNTKIPFVNEYREKQEKEKYASIGVSIECDKRIINS